VKGYFRTPKFLFIGGIIINLFLFSIHNLHGKNGPIEILSDIRHDPSAKGVLFLTECHLTPYYSITHKNIKMRFPDCSPVPRLAGNDENTLFFKDP
jgi:phosphatidylinositol glycan class B